MPRIPAGRMLRAAIETCPHGHRTNGSCDAAHSVAILPASPRTNGRSGSMTQPPTPGPPPQAALMQLVYGPFVARMVAAMAELGVPDLLAAQPRTAEALAATLGLNSDTLGRMLRALAGIGVFGGSHPAPGPAVDRGRAPSLTPPEAGCAPATPAITRSSVPAIATPARTLPRAHRAPATTEVAAPSRRTSRQGDAQQGRSCGSVGRHSGRTAQHRAWWIQRSRGSSS